MKQGSITTTYKMKLFCKHIDWIIATKELYSKVQTFYYFLLLEHDEFAELSNQNKMRELEKLTITSRDGIVPVKPLPFHKVPVYFRRAAINAAIGAVASYGSRYENWEKQVLLEQDETEDGDCLGNGEVRRQQGQTEGGYCPTDLKAGGQLEQVDGDGQQEVLKVVSQQEQKDGDYCPSDIKTGSQLDQVVGQPEQGAFSGLKVQVDVSPARKVGRGKANASRKSRHSKPSHPTEFCTSPVFYKGMYKEFERNSILLKLWTGSSWTWVKCKLNGRTLPEGGEILSPRVVINKSGKQAYLHVPIKEQVTDARPVKDRMISNEKVCGISFTNGEHFAVCAVFTADGRMTSSKFVGGGKEYVHHSKRLLGKIQESNEKMGRHKGKFVDWTGANKRYWEHLYNLGEYYAHKVSREIVEFCKVNGVKTIGVPEFGEEFKGMLAAKTGKYCPLYLSRRIVKYLKYKAWAQGIVVTGVRPHYISNKCSVCRAYILKNGGTGNKTDLDSRTGKVNLAVETSNVKVGQKCSDVVELPESKAVLQELGKNDQQSAQEFLCPSGHRGNRALNTARNTGKMCLKKFGKQTA